MSSSGRRIFCRAASSMLLSGTVQSNCIPVVLISVAMSICMPLKVIPIWSVVSLSGLVAMFCDGSGSIRKLSNAMPGGIRSLIGRSKATTVARCPGWLKVVRNVK